jgi:hypothetical protein
VTGLSPEYNRHAREITDLEMHEDGQTEVEAKAKIALNVLLWKTRREIGPSLQ